MASAPVYRDFTFGVTRAVLREAGGNHYLRCEPSLEPYLERMTDRLVQWAQQRPDATLFAQRDPALGGQWRHLSFAQALDGARRVGQALLNRGLSVERPLVILGPNSLDHALLALGAMYAGVAFCAVSPAYSLVSKDYDKLRHVMHTLTPGLVFAPNWPQYGPSIDAVLAPEVEVSLAHLDGCSTSGRMITPFSNLLGTQATAQVDAAMRATGPETVVKFLFTSGSTKLPKAVINTQRMICSNQQMLCEAFPFLVEEPPVLLDWLPWHHTFGGNHNLGLVLYNGGTLYMDDGRPVAGRYDESLRNLAEIATHIHFNVPLGFAELVRALKADAALRRIFFSRMRMMFYSSAGLPQHIWDELDELALAERGERIPMITGLGATETAPFAICVREEFSESGAVGLPVPGVELKLTPVGGKMEARVRGPSITPGYWRDPAATEAAFDEEGWYRFGDALVPLDPGDLHKGFRFDGRITEDFKLATGTWVSVGPLRARLVAALAPYVKDIVIGAPDRDMLTAILVPEQQAVAAIVPAGADAATHPGLRALLLDKLRALGAEGGGSSQRIARATLLTDPLSIEAGELTDKASINQRAVLARRATLVAELYAAEPPPHVMIVGDAG